MMDWAPSVQGQRAAFIWFTESQLGSVIRNNVVPEWFHGIISRKTAEELLMSKPPGYFLIRISESRIGYTLSYRTEDRCRHFMIDALEDGQYIIIGENRPHRFLQDLVDFHRRTPIVPFNEVLTVACGQASNDQTDYAELLFPQRHLNQNTSLQPNPLLPPSTGQPAAQEDLPPALPDRPNNLSFSTVVSPNRLYPSLEEKNPQDPPPATPVPMPRHRYLVDSPPSNQPPEVPARRSFLQLKKNQACIRTVSAPERHSPPADSPFGVSNLPVINLKNLKKKFQKKPSINQEFMRTEIKIEADNSEDAEHEYQEITREETFYLSQFSYTDGRLPQEYLHPPPFAPGHCS